MKKYTFFGVSTSMKPCSSIARRIAELAAARMIAEAAATKEASATHALAARCAKAGLQSAVSFMVWSETTMLAGEALSNARAAVRAADEGVAARHSDWSSAAARVAALEHLDDRGREAHTLEQRREETKIADDIVTTRWDRS